MIQTKTVDSPRVKAFRVAAQRGVTIAPVTAFGDLNACFAEDSVGRGKAHVEQASTRAELVLERQGETLYMHATVSAVDNQTWWDAAGFGLAADDTVTVTLQAPGFARALACHLTTEWWTVPSYVATPSDVPPRTQFLLWQREDGEYVALVPLVGDESSTFVSGGDGCLHLTASTGDDRRLRAHVPLFVMRQGRDPFAVVEGAYEEAMRVLGHPGKLRKQKRFPACFDRIGWCTWDAFYRDVTAEGIGRQLAHFARLGLPLGFLLIDDGWYPMHNNQLVDVRVDATRFPEGLGAVVQTAREQYGVKDVGVWHALTGYWCGIAGNHTLPSEFHAHLQPLAQEFGPSTHLPNAFAFYELWHRRLAEAGVSFIKVDGQGAMHRYSRNHMPIGEGARNVQKALQASTGANFDGQILNCMSMRQELMWQWGMANLARSSNDYMIHGKQSDPGEHAQVNVANAVYFSQLSWCDFDMFRTDQAHADFHMHLRALSGGPVYISDAPAVTNIEVLWPLMFADGKLVRCDDVGVPTEDCLLVDAAKTRVPLKVQNRAGHAGILGVFAVSPGPESITGMFRPSDVRGLPGEQFAVWSHGLRQGRCLAANDSWPVNLAPTTSEVFVIAPVQHGFAPIGVVDKIVAPKTIAFWRQRDDEVRLLLVEGGLFVAHAATRPRTVKVEGKSVPFMHEDGWLQVQVPKGVGSIDVSIAF